MGIAHHVLLVGIAHDTPSARLLPSLPRMKTAASSIRDGFRRFARHTANLAGTPWCFIAAASTIAGWATLGPHFGFSDTWQLVINTGTSLVTFLMVFLIQNTQNRDAREIHIKLDELLRAIVEARTGLIELEELSDEQLAKLHREFQRLCGDRHLEQLVEPAAAATTGEAVGVE